MTHFREDVIIVTGGSVGMSGCYKMTESVSRAHYSLGLLRQIFIENYCCDDEEYIV